MSEYVSSVLRCNIDEDGCSVCEFLNGSRKTEDMLEVIRILDLSLRAKEIQLDSLTEALCKNAETAP